MYGGSHRLRPTRFHYPTPQRPDQEGERGTHEGTISLLMVTPAVQILCYLMAPHQIPRKNMKP